MYCACAVLPSGTLRAGGNVKAEVSFSECCDRVNGERGRIVCVRSFPLRLASRWNGWEVGRDARALCGGKMKLLEKLPGDGTLKVRTKRRGGGRGGEGLCASI